jgi:mono/diheme cytochrome c family protein
MKKHYREFIGFTSIFLSLCLFVTAFAFAAPKTEKAAAGGDGQKIFEGKCTQCHGKDGKGVAKMAKVLKAEPKDMDLTSAETAKLTEAEMIKVVSDGKKKMPKYKGKLTDEQIQSVVQYLRTIQGSGASK